MAPSGAVDVTSTPKAFQISATRGKSLERNLLLESKEAVTELKSLPLDLSSSDNRTVLLANAIALELTDTSLQPNKPLPAKLKLDLTKAPSGEFQGAILLKFKDGEREIPLALNIKDRYEGAIALLVVGVLLGSVLSHYRSKGLSRDETLVKVGELRGQLRSDLTCPDVFRDSIEKHLLRTETLLLSEDSAAAQASLAKAQEHWFRWQDYQKAWLANLKYHGELHQAALDEPGEEIFYGKAVLRKLEDVLLYIPEHESPEKLGNSLQQIALHIENFRSGSKRLSELGKLYYGPPIPSEITQMWKMRAMELEDRLFRLSLDDPKSYPDWDNDVDETVKELGKALEKLKGESEADDIRTRAAASPQIDRLSPPPGLVSSISREEDEKQRKTEWIERAPFRLQVFRWACRGLMIVFLSAAGFYELYTKDAQFGAEPINDYTSLLAWGFGAEVTRESITKVIQNLGSATEA